MLYRGFLRVILGCIRFTGLRFPKISGIFWGWGSTPEVRDCELQPKGFTEGLGFRV